ncbi:nickel-dependent hydrogenase large subunit [Belnapia sp. T6]|uniref:Nickel-dependent hydrogenase large subunit n=1 Tax=Belnapia mucosa TaxID=2804532 RepID=A0ABS1VA41_9PROT|nr:nickel-dependent hydrogenase large subunit [Belnapia mucosa]MBL6458535.1 nickel-dependent hydrogenase large subunit [Belnapia mucosa]
MSTEPEALLRLIRHGQEQPCRPHPRHLLDRSQWAALVEALAASPEVALLGLWAEPAMVHAALVIGTEIRLVSCAAPEGRYQGLSPVRPAAAWFERMIRDLWGLVAEDGIDQRPWLDHGRWPATGPLALRPGPAPLSVPQPVFLPVEGEGVHQIPVGPVHAGVIEPGHFRFHVQGETVVRLEVRLGYVHKGQIGLMLGRPPRAAARFAARLSGDSTVAHSWAFAQAVEAATGAEVPPRALALRALMAELERLHNHLNDWGFACNDAAFAWPHARAGALREALLRAAAAAFGHRLMMDRVVPGGVTDDLRPGGAAAIEAALEAVAAELPRLASVYEGHASLADRVVGTGTVAPALAARFAAGGVVGRASGRDFDARRWPGYAPYGALTVPVLAEGDVDARLRLRLAEIGESIRLARGFLEGLPEGPLAAPLPQRGGEGLGLVEGFRGECLHWVALDDGGLLRAAFPRDPSWLHWPLLEAAIEGNIVADFPLINKSINGSYSGVDL